MDDYNIRSLINYQSGGYKLNMTYMKGLPLNFRRLDSYLSIIVKTQRDWGPPCFIMLRILG